MFSNDRVLFLDLSYNSFSGAVPRSVCRMVNLKVLLLNNNAFSKTFPAVSLPYLQTLFLNKNMISGPIPVLSELMPSLEWLDVSSNQFRGRLPASLPSSTFIADFSFNQIVGTIPDSWANIAARRISLKYLNLYQESPFRIALPLTSIVDISGNPIMREYSEHVVSNWSLLAFSSPGFINTSLISDGAILSCPFPDPKVA